MLMSDHFQIFDLPRRYELDPHLLEERYRALSRRWHPDRHGGATAAERVHVLRRATDLNDAYRTLRNDASRAEYLLRLHGVDVAAEGKDRPPVDPAFLAEILELREALHEAQEARDEEKVRALGAEVAGRMAADQAAIAAAFRRLEEGDQGMIQELSRLLVAGRYYRRFQDEIDAYEGA
jgi:molecular chaperone HscB